MNFNPFQSFTKALASFQISIHDVYIEICPSRFTGADPEEKQLSEMIEEGEEENPEFGDDDETVMKIVREPPIMLAPLSEKTRCSKRSAMSKIRPNGPKCVRMMSKVSEQEEETFEANDKVKADDSAVNGGCSSSFSERPQTTLAETSL